MKTRARYLIVGLAAAFLLLTGAGAVYAAGQMGAMMMSGDGGADSMMDDGDGMGSMMGGGGMGGSMMGGDGMGEDQMMGSFDGDKPFDLQFIDQMTMHHQGAIMSSKMMISDSKRPELRELAADIEESQSRQIEMMKDMRDEWYPDARDTSGMMGDEMMEDMMGGSMQGMMDGNATDEMFLRMMIPHHQMAVDMSERALEEAAHPELKELARAIKDEQSAEIELMRGYLEEIEGVSEADGR